MADRQADDQEIQYWLDHLRDGSADEKTRARAALADVFERRGMLEEAMDLLIANIHAGVGVRDPKVYRQLARLYRQQGQEHLAIQAAAEAAKLLESEPRTEPTSLVVRPDDVREYQSDEGRERASRLNAAIQQYIRAGYRIESQTADGVQLRRPKTFSFLWATLWFLLCGFGVLVYIFWYMAKKDDVVYLSVSDYDGQLQAQRSGRRPITQVSSGQAACRSCGHVNSSNRQSCKVCRAPLT